MSLLSQFLPKSGTITNTIPIEIFAVGGGGGGGLFDGFTNYGGGGGGGQVLYQKLEVDIGISYPITIGAGGVSGDSAQPVGSGLQNGGKGSNTTFGYITCFGGGGGLTIAPPVARYSTNSFGSSGGSTIARQNFDSVTIGVFIPSVISPEGFRLQNTGSPNKAPGTGQGGGGAAVGAGYYFQASAEVKGQTSPNGYDGIDAGSIGISTFFVGGGGCGGFSPTGSGGIGGGGGPNVGSRNGTANTGGGGMGGPSPGPAPGTVGGSGGSGVLFVRYPTDYAAATVTGNTPAPSQPGYYVYRWNSGPGSITFNN